ncbi:hypothetical protein M758_UG156400 [Ceratodon purpureus]|nr:hypothetical protein M758_UG156400 [Ceratodon purpureus]
MKTRATISSLLHPISSPEILCSAFYLSQSAFCISHVHSGEYPLQCRRKWTLPVFFEMEKSYSDSPRDGKSADLGLKS